MSDATARTPMLGGDVRDVVAAIGRHSGWVLTFGILSILFGVVLLVWPGKTIVVLAVFLGAYLLVSGFGWLFRGLAELFEGIAAKGAPGRGWEIFMGILGILAGLVVLLYPEPSLFVLATVSGIWLIILGIFEIVGAFRLRNATQ